MLVIMILWSICFIIGITCAACDEEDTGGKIYGVASLIAFVIFWIVTAVDIFPPANHTKKTTVENPIVEKVK